MDWDQIESKWVAMTRRVRADLTMPGDAGPGDAGPGVLGVGDAVADAVIDGASLTGQAALRTQGALKPATR